MAFEPQAAFADAKRVFQIPGIAQALQGAAETVRVIRLPDVGEKGDVSDWLDAGYSVDELRRLTEDALPWVPDTLPAAGTPALRLLLGGGVPEASGPGALGDADSHTSDYGNARHLVAWSGADVRYCYDWARWLVWTGTHWQADRTGAPDRIAKKTALQIYNEVAAAEDDETRKAFLKHAKYSESGAALREMVRLAQSELGFRVEARHLDADPHLLNCLNGTLELLLAGELRGHRPEDLITRVVPAAYDPEAQCPMWEGFLHRIIDGNDGLISFIRRAVGYTLTGDTRERCFFIVHGMGPTARACFWKRSAACWATSTRSARRPRP